MHIHTYTHTHLFAYYVLDTVTKDIHVLMYLYILRTFNIFIYA